MPARERSLADGQLSDSSDTILSGDDVRSVASGRVAVALNNTDSGLVNVYILFQRAGGTARRLAKIECPGDKGFVVHGIAMESDDTLLAYAETADVVDYVVFADGKDVPFTVSRLDGNTILEQMEEHLLSIAH